MKRQLQSLLREVAQEKNCTQADLKRAIAQYAQEPVTTKEEILGGAENFFALALNKHTMD